MKNLALRIASAITVTAVSACVSGPSSISADMASDREIQAYVTEHWTNFQFRLAYLVGKQGQSSTLLSVEAVDCGPSEGHIACTFSPRARFADGTVSTAQVEGMFGRQPDGSLEQLLRVERAP